MLPNINAKLLKCEKEKNFSNDNISRKKHKIRGKKFALSHTKKNRTLSLTLIFKLSLSIYKFCNYLNQDKKLLSIDKLRNKN